MSEHDELKARRDRKAGRVFDPLDVEVFLPPGAFIAKPEDCIVTVGGVVVGPPAPAGSISVERRGRQENDRTLTLLAGGWVVLDSPEGWAWLRGVLQGGVPGLQALAQVADLLPEIEHLQSRGICRVRLLDRVLQLEPGPQFRP